MKYETPQVTALTPAADAIHSTSKPGTQGTDNFQEETTPSFEDWED